MTNVAVSTNGEPRLVALSRIEVLDGFNPRAKRDPKRFAQLVASIKADGVLSPVLVAPNGEHGYRLIAGEGRYLAAAEAGCTEIPVLVRHADEQTEGLAYALAENLAREELDPVEQARGFQRLIAAGLTRKGVAERLGVAQRLVTERLQILELPEELHDRVADATIPPGAVRSLLALAKLHSQLPVIVAGLVGRASATPWDEELTWSQVTEDPIGAVIACDGDDETPLPDDVFVAGNSYPVARFTLTDKRAKDLTALCELIGGEPADFVVRFGRESVEQAQALGAAHASAQGWQHLIVGQDVGDQLAGDYVAACLKVQRKHAQAATTHATSTADDGPDAPGEDELAERRRAERDAEQQRREAAYARNCELGAAVLRHLARLKPDADVLKVLAAVDVAGDLDAIAMRGARYGFPGWPQEVQRKNGTTKVEYLDRAQCGVRAREFLAGAKTAADVAGRCLCLVAMARYADEQAVARSARSFFELRIGRSLPWSAEVDGLIEQLCSERLPGHLIERGTDAASAVEQAA